MIIKEHIAESQIVARLMPRSFHSITMREIFIVI